VIAQLVSVPYLRKFSKKLARHKKYFKPVIYSVRSLQA